MLTTKLFIGCPITPDLRIELNQSLEWKQSRFEMAEGRTPVEIQYESRHYLGFFVEKPETPLGALRDLGAELRRAIKSYCSEYPVDSLRVSVFPQVFVS